MSLLSLACSNGEEPTATETETGAELKERAFPGRSGEIRSEVLALPGLEVQPITYELIDGNAVFQGDIMFDLDKARALAKAAPADEVSRSTGRANELSRWVGGIVPYLVNGSATASDARIDQSGGAIAHWETVTPIRFRRRTNEPNYINFVTTDPKKGCLTTNVGRNTGGVVTIYIQSVAPVCTRGNTIHEIGHAVGLWHEQSRADRDANIVVHWNEIQDGRGPQFQTYLEQGGDGFDNQGVDFGSVMMYDSFAWAKGSNPTMTKASDGSTWNSQRVGLSPGDINGVGRMYPRFTSLSTGAMATMHTSYGAGISTWAPGRLDVVAVNDNGNLVHQYFEGGWSGWVDNWGGVFTSGLDSVSWAPGRLDVVGRGTDLHIYHFFWDNGNTGWDDLGGISNFAPAITTFGPNTLDVFTIGSDNQLYQKAYRLATGWEPNWTPRGGILNAGVDGVAIGGRIDLVSRNSANHIVHKAWTGSWDIWRDMAGFAQGEASIASWQPNRWDLFAQGADNDIWKRSFQIEWEANWGNVGGGYGADPDVVSWGVGRFDVVARDATGILRHAFVSN